MIDTEALRIKVLDLAFHGTLIHQVKDDRSVDVLYRDVRKKKEALIASKVIKAERKVSNIVEDEMPDDIPATWKYVPFEHVIYEIGNKTNQVKESELTTKGKVPAISQSAKFIEGYSDAETKVINNKPLVMFGDHTRNVKYIDFPFVICADGCKFFKTIDIDTKYFYFWLRYAASKIDNKGYARHYSLLRKQLFPLAPLKEERSIVEYVESCFEVLNEIDELQQQYANNITSLNKNILDLAVMGKLVPQDPNDEPASVLLKKVAEEKQKLIKDGKIKKQKALPAITENEIPFYIPESWEWVRLNEIIENAPANGFSPKGVDYPTNYKNLTLTATTSGTFKADAFKYVDITKEQAEKYFLKEDDILIQRSNSKELVGTTCLYTEGPDKYIYPDLMMRIHALDGICPQYLVIALQSPYVRAYYQQNASGSSQSMPKINQSIVGNTLIPLPPLHEQKKIVQAVKKAIPTLASLS